MSFTPINALGGIAAAFQGTGLPLPGGGGATTSNTGSASYTFTADNIAGGTIVVFAGLHGTGPLPLGVTTVADTQGNTYTLITESEATDSSVIIIGWYAQAVAAGPNVVTVAISGTTVDFDLQVQEWGSTLGALDVWAGGDNIGTGKENMNTLTPNGGSGDEGLTTNFSDVIILFAYNPQWAGLPFGVYPGGFTQANVTQNPNGETSVLAYQSLAVGTYVITIEIPYPVCPSGGPTGQLPVPIGNCAIGRTHAAGTTSAFQQLPCGCGPFEIYDPVTNVWNLYAVLQTLTGPGSGTAIDCYKSTDGGLTWAIKDSSPGGGSIQFGAPAKIWGHKIYCLYNNGGLLVSTFDTATDTWTATTTVATGTNVSGTQSLNCYDFCTPAEDVFFLVYTINPSLLGSPDTSVILWSGGAWATPTLLASGSLLAGTTFDFETTTFYVAYMTWTLPVGPAPYLPGPRDLLLSTITSFSWPFTPPTPDTVEAAIVQNTSDSVYPSIGKMGIWRGGVYLPYSRNTGGGYVASIYVPSVPGTWGSQDLLPVTSEGYTGIGYTQTSIAMLWCETIADQLYVFWSDDVNVTPCRIRFAVAPDGILPNNIATFYNVLLNPPDDATFRQIFPGDNISATVATFSMGQLFGYRLGVIANLVPFDLPNSLIAYFLPLSANPTPVSTIGNSFY